MKYIVGYIICIHVSLFCLKPVAGKNIFEPFFQNIGIDEGLSNYDVYSICQDSIGYIWIGTARGLNRYDGNSFKHYFFNPENPGSGIPNNQIDKIFYAHNHLFVGTPEGATVFDQRHEKWIPLPLEITLTDLVNFGSKTLLLSNGRVFEYNYQSETISKCNLFNNMELICFIHGNEDFIWGIAKNRQSLIRLNPQGNELISFPIHPFIKGNPSSAYVLNNKVFIGTDVGISVFEINDQKLIASDSNFPLQNQLEGKTIMSISYLKGTVLIVTFVDGIYTFNPKSSQIGRVSQNDNITNLSSGILNTCFIDRDQNLWIGTFDKGIDVYYNKLDRFNFDPQLNKITEKLFINAIIRSSKTGELWMGSRNNGILKYDFEAKSTSHLSISEGNLNGNMIMFLFEDSQQKVWIGMYKGTQIFDQKKNALFEPEYAGSLKHIQFISEKNNKIYLAVPETGICIYDLAGKKIRQIDLPNSPVNQIIHLNDNEFLFCNMNDGLLKYRYDKNIVEKLSLNQDGNPLKIKSAVALYRNSDSIVWVGTRSWGLYRVNIKTGQCINYNTSHGLPSNDIIGIEKDKYGRLWLSTSFGLSCFFDNKFINFFNKEGIRNYQFHQRSSLNDDGVIYFGGNNGLTYFKPDDIIFDNKSDLRVALSSFNIANDPVRCNDETHILKQAIPYTSNIVLTYRYPSFTIEYLTLDYFASEQTVYSYKLKGWQDEWINSVNNSASYMKLKPGKYTFMVKSQGFDKNWTKPTELNIRVLPAPWYSWWAYTIYSLILIILFYEFFHLVYRAKLLKVEKEKEQNIRKHETEVNEMKLRFFTNISHELRTPLTLIYAITESFSENSGFTESQQRLIGNLRYNTDRLKRLVDQLLIFRKLEKETLELSPDNQNIIVLTRAIVAYFDYIAEKKGLKIKVENSLEHDCYWVDSDLFEKILSNILTNSIKYTESEGKITVKLRQLNSVNAFQLFPDVDPIDTPESKAYLYVSIQDTGCGISSEALPFVFDRYNNVGSKIDSGTGIGLNFVKRIVELQGGRITAESILGEGTTISFILPLKKGEQNETTVLYKNVVPQLVDLPEQDEMVIRNSSSYSILIVEDDLSLNAFLKETLKDLFNVYVAFDSHEALIIAKNKFPDIIISDIMMRHENEGLQFCAEIKQNELLSHIPVILLTAKIQDQQIVQGYDTGADAYITKPFSIHILKAQILGLIKNRERLQMHIRNGNFNVITSQKKKEVFNQNDIGYLKKINIIIEKEYQNPDFNIILLANELSVSRSGFYKKFMQLTKLSPNDYLRKFRINKAIELLDDAKYSITEIGEMVGFNSRSGFFTSFKKEKGMSPTDYMNKI